MEGKNLVKEGFEVTGFDVYQPLVDSFVEAGGKSYGSNKHAMGSRRLCSVLTPLSVLRQGGEDSQGCRTECRLLCIHGCELSSEFQLAFRGR